MNRVADQYRIIADGGGWIDKRSRGRLRFDGPDAAKFLHALVTNDVLSLCPGQGVYAAYLTPQGRMLADLIIHHCGDYLLADVAPGEAERLAARFDQVIFAEDVRVSNVSGSIAQIGLVGEMAASMLAHAFALNPVDPLELSALPVFGHLRSGAAVVVRTDDAALPCFDVFVRADMYDAVVTRLDELGAQRVPETLVEGLRIDAGRPAYGVDMTEETIPLEAGLLDRAISTTKGCYVGQEIIIRVLHRGGGRVAKRLAKLAFDPSLDKPPSSGTLLLEGDREVGRITSAAISPTRHVVVALAYVHRDQAEEGRQFTARIDGASIPASIIGFAG
jgi:folate-binding protein YgfZ